MNFTPEQIQNNLGKYNTEQYEYGKLENTGDNREKVANQPASKKEVDELRQLLKKNEERDHQQEVNIQNATEVNKEQDKRIAILDGTMKGSETVISDLLVTNGLNYDERTGMFSSATPTKEPGARLFGSNSAELEARQA